MRKLSTALIILLASLLLAACQPPDSDQRPTSDWPGGLVTPITEVTFSMSEAHLPGSNQPDDAGQGHGFAFVNGYSGRPLMPTEAVVAVTDGEVVRIDHDHSEPNTDLRDHWLSLASEAGFPGAFARDQLYGRQIWLRHASGHLSRYAQLSQVHPELVPGDPVEQGQIIGLASASGQQPLAGDGTGAAPALIYELWTPDANSYLGEGLETVQTHRLLAELFSRTALPRYAQHALDDMGSGKSPPGTYPPENLDLNGFNADLPEAIVAGTTFTIFMEWDEQEFHADDIFASLNGQPLGILKAEGGAVAMGAVPIEADYQNASIILGGIDQFGQTLLGETTIQIQQPVEEHQPLEVDASILALYSEENQTQELELIQRATELGLNQRTPAWSQPFQAPLNGSVEGEFGQSMIHGVMLPQHPLPGILILPTGETTVFASNDGVVVLVAELPIRGSTVAIAHGGGLVSFYSRLHNIDVSEGDTIRRGEPLGFLRENGNIQDRILLWEIQIAGVSTNPQNWLDRVMPQ